MEPNCDYISTPLERRGEPTPSSAPRAFYNQTKKEEKAGKQKGAADTSSTSTSTATGIGHSGRTSISREEEKEIEALEMEGKYIIGKIVCEEPQVSGKRRVRVTWKGFPGDEVIDFSNLGKALRGKAYTEKQCSLFILCC